MSNPSPISLRLDPELRAWITQAAQQNERSISGEIRHRLAQARQAEQRKTRRQQSATTRKGGRKHA